MRWWPHATAMWFAVHDGRVTSFMAHRCYRSAVTSPATTVSPAWSKPDRRTRSYAAFNCAAGPVRWRPDERLAFACTIAQRYSDRPVDPDDVARQVRVAHRLLGGRREYRRVGSPQGSLGAERTPCERRRATNSLSAHTTTRCQHAGSPDTAAYAATAVSGARIQHFAATVHDPEPLILGRRVHAQAWGGLIAPPAMLMGWVIPPPWRTADDAADAVHRDPRSTSRNDVHQRVERRRIPRPPIREGDRLHGRSRKSSPSPRKRTTRLGTGHFVETLDESPP